MEHRYLPDLPEGFFGADAAFLVFVAEGADAFAMAGVAMLTGSGSAGASFG